MAGTVILAADAYRMIDALKDYADILELEGYHNNDLVNSYHDAAERIEMTERVGNGLIFVRQFDLDMAQSAVLMVMVNRRERADALRAEADALSGEAGRYEALLGAFIV